MKKYILTIVSFVAAVVCGVSYNIIGSEVAPDGTLVEPFFLIPLTYLFLLIAIISAISVAAISFTKSRKKSHSG
ncbi:Protein of unknown function [Peptoclostridium litorale DSM 5388]|uniref:DUF3955 domain-containing protein n=1 Tax=Peptoclostridium litorale DSM 5388 TaxID=1121324 RepID=A0A069RK99_PEPLI|nr:DUF3955 domain-containing protein [Peptoclostridium litorale]KDR96555.1 hypothetical protein CLIT_2c01610 [Peptoclostridium litorale DSM 5388]SIN69195.1 Protein of unknown function [Peptoclostridium litorale DSM 5388]